jgi:hypothetical protein
MLPLIISLKSGYKHSYIKKLLTFPEKKSYNPNRRVTEGVNPDNGFAPFLFYFESGGFTKWNKKTILFSQRKR